MNSKYPAPPPHVASLTIDRTIWRNELAMSLAECADAVRAAEDEAALKLAADTVLKIAEEVRNSIGLGAISDVAATLRRATERLAHIRNHG